MKENDNISEISLRFLEVISDKGYTNYKLSKEVDVFTEAKLSHIKTGRNQPSDELINALLNKFPDIRKSWLLAGEGEKYLNSSKPKLEAKPLRLADPEGFEATGEKIYKLPYDSLIMQVPVIPYKAWGSYLRGHADPEFYDGLQTMPVPVDQAHKGSYLIFEIGGNSMENPGSRKCIWVGEKLIGRNLKRDNWKYKLHMNSTNCWIIVHRERGIVVKEIIAHDIDSAEITLHSWNPDKIENPDYIVSLNDVEQIFNVVDPFNKFG